MLKIINLLYFYRLVSYLEGISIKIPTGAGIVGSRRARRSATNCWRAKSKRSSTQSTTWL